MTQIQVSISVFFLFRMNRFNGIKCVHCGETIKRKSDNPAEPFCPQKTCLVCGKITDLFNDIPLKVNSQYFMTGVPKIYNT